MTMTVEICGRNEKKNNIEMTIMITNNSKTKLYE